MNLTVLVNINGYYSTFLMFISGLLATDKTDT
jgi:hypothetical protein